MDEIGLALCYKVKCAYDNIKEMEEHKDSKLSELEKALFKVVEEKSVESFEQDQASTIAYQAMFNGLRAQQDEERFDEVARAAQADRAGGGVEKMQGDRQKKGPKAYPGEEADDEVDRSRPRRKGRPADSQPAAAMSPFGSAVPGDAGPKQGTKRYPSQEPKPISREPSKPRVSRSETGYSSDKATELPMIGRKGAEGMKGRGSGPSPGKKRRPG